MTALKIVLIILGVFLLIGHLPVGAYCRYDGDSLIQLCVGPLRIRLYPPKPKNRKQREKAAAKAEKAKAEKARKKKDKKEKALIQKNRKEEQTKQPLADKISGIVPFVKLVRELLGRFRKKFLIQKLIIRVKLAGADPARLGVNNGRAWAAIASAMPILKSRFRIRSSDVQVSPDFLSTKTELVVVLHVRFLVGDLIAILLKFGLRGLKLYSNRQKQQNSKKAVQK